MWRFLLISPKCFKTCSTQQSLFTILSSGETDQAGSGRCILKMSESAPIRISKQC